jgi:guanylate cyclase
MLESIWVRVSNAASTIGGEVPDSNFRIQKTVLVVLSFSAIPLGLIWTPIEFFIGDPRSGIATGVIAGLIFLNFLFYVWVKNFSIFRLTQLAIFISFPFVLHFAVGGYTKSANVAWGLATPLIALLSSRPRAGTPWIIAYVGLVAISGLLDPVFFPGTGLDMGEAFFEFSLNIINGALIVYFMLIYFVHQKNRAFQLLSEEEEKSERLLLNVLPEEVAPALKSGNETIAKRFEEASILFADIVDFTPLSAQMDPEEMVKLLNQIFSAFDLLVEKYDCEKIRTIGDNYMVASGLPRPREDHAKLISRLALEIGEYIKKFPSQGGRRINFRIGINSGSVVAGVIGKHRFHYDVWGDPVNTASRMESAGVPGEIQISDATRVLIEDEFLCEPRGKIPVKGKGEMETWFLRGLKLGKFSESLLPGMQPET